MAWCVCVCVCSIWLEAFWARAEFMPYGSLRGWRGWRHFHEQTDANKPLVRTRFNGRRIMFNADLQKWTPVKPKKNQTARDQAAKKPKNQTLAPKMMEKEMADEEEKKFQELRTKMQEAIKEEEKKLQEITKSIENERSERTRLEQEIKEEEKKFQELTNKVAHQIKEARAALYAT